MKSNRKFLTDEERCEAEEKYTSLSNDLFSAITTERDDEMLCLLGASLIRLKKLVDEISEKQKPFLTL
jgi:hypothetical protein